MEHSAKQVRLTFFFVAIFLSLFSLVVMAQSDQGSNGGGSTSTTVTKTTSTTSNTWYTSPWVWIVGAAVFILLLVALLSNRGGSSDTIRVTKTVERDSNA